MAERSPFALPAALLTTVLIGFLLVIGKFLLLPFIVALLLCMVLKPLLALGESRRIPWWAMVSALLLAIAGGLWWVGGTLVDSARDFLASLQESSAASAPASAPAGAEAAAPADLSIASLQRMIADEIGGDYRNLTLDKALELVKKFAPRLAGYLVGTLVILADVMANIGLVLFFMLMIFAEQSMSRRKIAAAAGERRDEVVRVLGDIDRDVRRFLSAKTMVSLGTGASATIGLWLLGVPYAPLFGLLTFLLDFIPAVGSLLAMVFPAVTAWTTTNSWKVPAGVAVLYLAVNMVFGNVIEPRVVGKQLNLSPLVIMISVMVWSALWGVAGMFLAVPLTRTVQLVLLNVPETRWMAILMSNGEPEHQAAR